MSYCQHIAVTWNKNAGAPEAHSVKGNFIAQNPGSLFAQVQATGTAPNLRLMV